MVCITREPYDDATLAWIATADSPEEKERRKQRAKYLRHKERYKARARQRYVDDPQKILDRNNKWRTANPEQVSEGKLAWERQDKLKDPEKYREKQRLYHLNNKDKVATRGKKWRQENPGKNCAKTARRKAALLQRTPAWADHDAINFFYECRPAGCEVDHIIPLQGKYISGLHIAENLQWLPRDQNRTKFNKWSAECG